MNKQHAARRGAATRRKLNCLARRGAATRAAPRRGGRDAKRGTGGMKRKQVAKKKSGRHKLKDGHDSGARAAGARKGFGDKVVLAAGCEIPIGGFRFCGVSRVGRREYRIESADGID